VNREVASVLVDTGPIVAILSASDQYHDVCTQQLRKITGPLTTCWPVVTEAAWLLRAHPRALGILLSSFNRHVFQLAALDETDLPAISAILARCADFQIQLADASLVHLANRERIQTVFTLDRRHFDVLRLARGKRFRVIP
jgi:uncharacterized protein